MKKIRMFISICMVLIGVYGLYWMGKAFFPFSEYSIIFMPRAILFSGIGYLGINRLRGKSNWSIMETVIFLFLLWHVCAFILLSQHPAAGKTLIDMYKSHRDILFTHFIVIPVLITDLILSVFVKQKEDVD